MTGPEYVRSLALSDTSTPVALEFITVPERLPVGHTFTLATGHWPPTTYEVTGWQYENPRLPGFVVALIRD